MEIRPVRPADLSDLADIDATVESSAYLHLERSIPTEPEGEGGGIAVTWKLSERPLREKRVTPNRLGDDTQFTLKQVATGADE